jgi:cation:H+ antiporter
MGSPGIAVGNVVGSNIANILLILGLSALIMPLPTARATMRRDGSVMVLSALLMVGVALVGSLGVTAGVLFLLGLLAYLVYTYRTGRVDPEGQDAPESSLSMPVGLVVAALGLGGVVFGADLLVGAAVVLARDVGLSESVIGLTLVAVGTSLPELVTSVMAAVRRHPDVAFGNVVGSNIFNVLGIAGITAVVSPIPVPPEIARFDVWVMLAATVLLVLLATTGWRLSRREGMLLLASYGLYLAAQLSPGIRGALGLA